MLKIINVEPSVLFCRDGNQLKQIVNVVINSDHSVEAKLYANLGSSKTIVNMDKINQGENTYQIQLPDMRESILAEFMLEADGKTQDRFKMEWIPRKHWEICLIPISHHDLGYTDTIEGVFKKYMGIYQDVLNFCEETENYPEEAKFRYMPEEAWSLQHFIENSSKETLEKLEKYIKQGRIEIPALFGNQISGMCSHEELIRLMYPSFRIKRQFGGDIKFGSITDIPGLSWGLPTVLSGAGVQYFFAGLPTYFHWGRNDIHTFWDEDTILRKNGRPDAFYWKGPDGSTTLVYYQGSYGCWSPHSYEQIIDELPAMLNQMDRAECPFSVMRYGGYGCGDNTGTDIIVSNIVKEWNNKWEYPKLIVSTSTMFFEKLEKQCEGIRTYSGELPHTDYAVGAMSTAKETTINRITHDKLHSAEKIATFANILLDHTYPSEEIREAYDNMLLYDEHTWGKAHQIGESQDWAWNEKSKYAYKSAGLTETILSENTRSIANSISCDEEGQYITVFNTLSFKRTDIVNIPNFFVEQPFKLIDAETGEEQPYQVVELDSPQAPVPYSAGRYARGQFSRSELFSLVFTAKDVPSMGYKTYRIIPETPNSFEPSIILTDKFIENRFYKVEIDSTMGTIKSIFDKELERELVDKDATHQVNQLITRLVKTGKEESPQKASIRKGQNGSIYSSIVISTSGIGCPQLTQEIVLYENIKRIDLNNRVLKDSTPTMELYFAFPFKMDNPDFRFEASNSVIKPLQDQFPGSNSNYYSVQHWADVSDGKFGITLSPIDSHLLEFGGLNPCYVSQAHHGFTPPGFGAEFVKEITKGYMYSFIIDSNFRTNFQPTQQGDILFRYLITTHEGDWINGQPKNFGWSIGSQLIGVPINANKNGSLPKSASLFQIDKSNILLMTLKKAEESNGIIIRLIETEGKDNEVGVSFSNINAVKAYQTDIVENKVKEIAINNNSITLAIKAFGINTILLQKEDK